MSPNTNYMEISPVCSDVPRFDIFSTAMKTIGANLSAADFTLNASRSCERFSGSR